MTKIEMALRDFAKRCGTEAEETKEAGQILRKHLSGAELSAEEKTKFKQQVGDVLKGVGIGIPMVLLPGATILVPVLLKVAKRYGVELMPSAFNKD